jgi:AraC-like DNA-binding protein
MLLVPLPFVAALFLLVLLARMVSEGGTGAMMRPFFILTGGYALLMTIIGLRWGYGMMGVLPLMSILAAVLPPLAWISFKGLTTDDRIGPRKLVHAVPAILVACFMLFLREAVDWVLVAISASYGVALLILAARGSDALDRVALDNATLVHRSLIAMGVMLLLSAIVDASIAVDFAMTGGVHAANVVGAANILGLLILGAAAAIAGRSPPPDTEEDASDPPAREPTGEDIDIAERVEMLLTEKQLYRDPELTLNRLARKAVIPARRISMAINRVKAQSVSRYVNAHRIAEACRLLKTTDRPVTAIMFEAGYQTKSNFNREFRSHTGASPAEWRRRNRAT